jgi:hypothetical protein
MPLLFLALLTALLAQGQSQPPKVLVLNIDVENSVSYLFDVADPTQRAVQQKLTTVDMTQFRAFNHACQVDDVVAVNGKPAKGIHFVCSWRMGFNPNPQPGGAVADAAFSNAFPNCNWELHSRDGRFVGRLVDGGFFPHSILGGAGAFAGAQGEHHFTPGSPNARNASVGEDPALRRTLPGGGKYTVHYYLTAVQYPEVLVSDGWPQIYHAADMAPVTEANPARAGELLTLRARNLGPTTPYTMPGQRFAAWPANPLAEVNSDVEVTIGGKAAEVVNKIGWPGEIAVYRVDFLMPGGVPAGRAPLQVTSAWMPSDEVPVAVR